MQQHESLRGSSRGLRRSQATLKSKSASHVSAPVRSLIRISSGVGSTRDRLWPSIQPSAIVEIMSNTAQLLRPMRALAVVATEKFPISADYN